MWLKVCRLRLKQHLGTPAGDPLEAGSLGSTFGQARGPGNPIFVGSVKTNIGHMEGASGLAGLIKAVYALENGAIPGNLWFEEANPRIPRDDLNMKVWETALGRCQAY